MSNRHRSRDVRVRVVYIYLRDFLSGLISICRTPRMSPVLP
jgi:hypothetical protein